MNSVNQSAKYLAAGSFLVILVFTGSALSIDSFGGEVAEAILDGEAVSSRWVGISGEIKGSRAETAESIFSFRSDDGNAGSVQTIDLDGINDGNHYFISTPEDIGTFNQGNLRNVSLAELSAGGLFDEDDFPVFYPDQVSYSSVSDNPSNTFTETSNLTVLGKPYEGPVTTLKNGIEMTVLAYQHNGEKIPIFVNKINDYSTCYDGNSCNYQMMMPNLQGEEYYVYQVSAVVPIKLNTYIDGEDKNIFPYAGRPYRLNVTTRSIFEGDKLVDRKIELIETQGNNLFAPAVEATSYKSSAKVITDTENGYKEFLFSPTGYSSPSGYNLSINTYNSNDEIAGIKYMGIENGNIDFTNEGPEEKDLGEYSTSYKKGVNGLTPIANCLFKNVNNGVSFELAPEDSTSSYTLVRGTPYIMNIGSSSADFYRLSEPGSHLAMSPSRSSEFGETVHMGSGNGIYSENDQVVFTPTIPKSEDDNFSLELLDGQGNLLQEVNISVKGSTCGSNEAGSFSTIPNSNDFKKRINSVTPILNSLFVAGT